MNKSAVFKVAVNQADLHLLAGDYLIVGKDGLPQSVVRKLDPQRATLYAQALRMPVVGPVAVRAR